MKAAYQLTMILLVLTAGAFIAGCEVGVNPLLFDGSPVEASFRVDDTTTTAYSGSDNVNLQDVRSATDGQIDSVKVINVTLLIDNTAGMDSLTTFSGTATVSTSNPPLTRVLFSMSGTPISAFATARSIFDPDLAALGFGINTTIVATLNTLLNDQGGPQTATIAFNGLSSSRPLHFTAHVKLYTQVYTAKKK